MMIKLVQKILSIATLFSFMGESTLMSSCNTHDEAVCQLEQIRTLYYDMGVHDTDTSYAHFILLREFSKECMDSVEMLNIALRYTDTVKGGLPVGVLHFYNSNKDFIPEEHSQDWEQVNKSCLVTIDLDPKTKKPTNFIFYNGKGQIAYWGKNWVPFPKGKDVYTLPQH